MHAENFDLPDTWFFCIRPHGASLHAFVSEYLAKMQNNFLFRFLELFLCKVPFFQNSVPITTRYLNLSYPPSTFLSSVWLLAFKILCLESKPELLQGWSQLSSFRDNSPEISLAGVCFQFLFFIFLYV